MSFNRATLIGNLGADPEMRRTNDGNPIATFSLATSETWRDRNSGERMERTEWHRVVCFNEGLCGIIEKYLRKGSQVLVEGKIQTRKWEDQAGNDRYSTEIVMTAFDAKLIMLNTRQGEGGRNYDTHLSGQSRGEHFGRDGRASDKNDDDLFSGRPARGSISDDLDDEIPF